VVDLEDEEYQGGTVDRAVFEEPIVLVRRMLTDADTESLLRMSANVSHDTLLHFFQDNVRILEGQGTTLSFARIRAMIVEAIAQDIVSRQTE
jgi:hypothetical protein